MVEIKKELDDGIVVIGLENKDFYVEVTNFGCTLLKAVVKDKEGNPCDCVLGFPEVSDYQKRDGGRSDWTFHRTHLYAVCLFGIQRNH